MKEQIKQQELLIEEYLSSYKKEEETYDLIDLYTFSIDAIEAKQFDDAISILKNDDNCILFVHITDIIDSINYHAYSSKKLKDFLDNHGNNVYKLNNSLLQGKNRKAITLVTIFDSNGKIIEYKFIKSIVNVNVNLNQKNSNNYIKSTSNEKNVCKQLKLFCELYKTLENKGIFLESASINNPGFKIVEETMNLYSYLLWNNFSKKTIGCNLRLLNSNRNKSNGFFLKATSPLYKGESYISQLLIHDFILNDNEEALKFWVENMDLIRNYLDKEQIDKSGINNKYYKQYKKNKKANNK